MQGRVELDWAQGPQMGTTSDHLVLLGRLGHHTQVFCAAGPQPAPGGAAIELPPASTARRNLTSCCQCWRRSRAGDDMTSVGVGRNCSPFHSWPGPAPAMYSWPPAAVKQDPSPLMPSARKDVRAGLFPPRAAARPPCGGNMLSRDVGADRVSRHGLTSPLEAEVDITVATRRLSALAAFLQGPPREENLDRRPPPAPRPIDASIAIGMPIQSKAHLGPDAAQPCVNRLQVGARNPH